LLPKRLLKAGKTRPHRHIPANSRSKTAAIPKSPIIKRQTFCKAGYFRYGGSAMSRATTNRKGVAESVVRVRSIRLFRSKRVLSDSLSASPATAPVVTDPPALLDVDTVLCPLGSSSEAAPSTKLLENVSKK
jgi:hypothetical protein